MTMRLTEIVGNIGKTATLRTAEGLGVEVKITDANLVYGNVRYKVEPVAGTGEAVVDAARLKIAA